jgi:SAM-dependent methyltransferase
MKCPVCASDSTSELDKLWDDRYAYPGRFTKMGCAGCGHIFLVCGLTARQLGDLYTNYYPRKSLDINKYHAYVEQDGFLAWINGLGSSAFRWVPVGVRVLDVGCGFGESIGYHAARGCDVYGVEADENIRRVIEKFGYKIHVGLFDENIYERDFFDYVTMDQVIEHVTDPITALQGIERILKPGGVVILSTPNANGWGANLFKKRWINWHAPYHLQFFSNHSIRIAAEKAGLVLTSTTTVTSSDWLLYQWIHLIAYPKLGSPSWFWSPDKSNATILKKIFVEILVFFHKTKINHLITRIFDGLNFGDNCVYILKKPE